MERRDSWRPAPGPGTLIGTMLGAIFLLTSVFLAILAVSTSGWLRFPFLLISLCLLCAVLAVGFLVIRLRSLRYAFDAREFVIEWRGGTLRTPYREIDDVVYHLGKDVRLARFERYWPGCYFSTIATPEGEWRSFATVSPGRRVRLQTSSGILAISPERPILFVQHLTERQSAVELIQRPEQPPPIIESQPAPIGSAKATIPERLPIRRTAVPRHPSWTYVFTDLFRRDLLGDPVATNFIALGIIMLVLMTVYSVYRIDNAFTGGPIHWDALRQPDRFVDARGGWIYALVAAVILIVNTSLATLAMAYDRFIARMLVVAIPATQILLAIAMYRTVR